MNEPATHLDLAHMTGEPVAGQRGWLSAATSRLSRRSALALALALGAATWLPRLSGPIDLRWDGGVYYLLGTSLAEGKGYRLLNEPGEINADQYPPLLPAMIAAHEKALGTSDMTRVGAALRRSAAALFLVYVWVVFRLFASQFSPVLALLGSALSMLTLHVYFLSDLSFPELPFSICLILFLVARRGAEHGVGSRWPYVWAVLAYALRTAGVAALAAWAAESVVAGRFRQATFRALLALAPVAGWQVYVASVESSVAYQHPAYAYQRAAYMFYNVSYSRNVALLDPFTPEKGPTSPVRLAVRFAHNALTLPTSIGETVTTARGYVEMGLHKVLGSGTAAVAALAGALLYLVGCVALTGLVRQALDRDWPVPIFMAAYFATLCLTPFPGQFLRYLMPIAPLLIAATMRLPAWQRRTEAATMAVLIVALAAKAAVAAEVFSAEHQRVSYIDPGGRFVSYRLFFYNAAEEDFDRTVDFLKTHAASGDIVASGTPQWIYLRTGLKSVMAPFEADPRREQASLDSVPVTFLVVGRDVVGTERYTTPMLKAFPAFWSAAFTSPGGNWLVYRRSPQS